MRNKNTIYLVDDDDDDRMFTREALESDIEGINIKEFTNGLKLLESLQNIDQNGEPSLIVLDINMPFINGLDVLSQIRSEQSLRHIPVVLFSTSSNPETIKKAYRAGVNAYLIKPVCFLGYKQAAFVVASFFINKKHPSFCPNFIASQKATNILVIEDNADHWELMRLALGKLGHVRLFHQQTAEGAIEFLESSLLGAGKGIDLIILDLYLPGRQQGLDLIGALRSFFIRRNLAPLPILVFSASDHKDDIKASYQRQANAYITKSSDISSAALYLNDMCSLWATTIAMPQAVNKL